MPENASDSNVPEWYLVTAPDGKRVGCLLTQFNHQEENTRIGLSHAKPCPPDILR
jgi:hypothetical protein